MVAVKSNPQADKPKTGIKRVKGENFYRNAKSASKVKMYNSGHAVRDRDGKIIESAAFQKTEKETAQSSHIQPDRKWFGNTRVISQTALDHFSTALKERQSDPYSVILKRNKVPTQLLQQPVETPRIKREVESFKHTFGPNSNRKRPTLTVGSFSDMAESINSPAAAEETVKRDAANSVETFQATQREPIYAKGTSRRIWAELYKVIDSSDIVLHVLDVRDPIGTTCSNVVQMLKTPQYNHKQLVFVLNKVDLVPTWVTAKWIKHLSKTSPTIAFHANINNSFGKGSLIQLLRQFSVLHSDKKQISVGFVGYPNVGKSSVINTLKKKKVCTVAPVPGETKVWQYITLMRRIYLIDCPGIVPVSARESDTDVTLKGVIRISNLATPTEHIPMLLERVRTEYLARTYAVKAPAGGWVGEEGANDLLGKIAKKSGKLLRGGEPDIETAAKMVLNDWIRGRIPFFVRPPDVLEEDDSKTEAQDTLVLEEKAQPKGVVQPIKQIVVMSKFLPDDAIPAPGDEVPDVDIAGDAEDIDSNENSDDEVAEEWHGLSTGNNSAAAEDSDGEDEEDEYTTHDMPLQDLGWDEVVKLSGVTPAANTSAKRSLPDDDNEDELESSGKRRKQVKEPRTTTSKKTATNFFTDANVKGKNRSRVIPKQISLKASKAPQDQKRRKGN